MPDGQRRGNYASTSTPGPQEAETGTMSAKRVSVTSLVSTRAKHRAERAASSSVERRGTTEAVPVRRAEKTPGKPGAAR